MSSPRRRFLLPVLTFNVPWDRGAQVTRQATAVLVRRTSFHNYYLVNHYYYNLVPMVPAVNKSFFKSFDLICRQWFLMLKPIQVPVLLLLQPNLLHHLTDLVLDWAVFWMVWQPRDNREIGGTNTAHHCVVDIRDVMRSKVVPNEHPMEISAGDIVRLNIRAHVVAKVAEYVGGGANGT